MYTSYHVKASELNEDFIASIKAMFRTKKISITIEEELDETEYLLSGKANRKMLERSLKSANSGNLTEIKIDKFLHKK